MRARPPTALVSRLVALALAVALLIPAALGGMRFVYCAPMQRAMLHACCPSERTHTPARHAALDAPCCQDRALSSLPAADPPRDLTPAVPPAPMALWLTIAAMFPLDEGRPTEALPSRARRARAGPESPLYDLHNAWLC